MKGDSTIAARSVMVMSLLVTPDLDPFRDNRKTTP